MSTDPKNPYPTGTRVRLARPEGAKSKRKGQAGTVIAVHLGPTFDPKSNRPIPGTDYPLCTVEFDQPLVVGRTDYGNVRGWYPAQCLDPLTPGVSR